MKLSSLAGVFVVFLSCLAAAPLVAEVPPPSSAAPAPSPVADTATSAPAAIDPAKEAEIRKLLEVTGTMKSVQQMIGRLVDTLRDHSPGLPADFWDHLQKELDPSTLEDKLVPVYDKHYTLDDLKAVNAFYQTPAGQHLLEVQPQVAKESLGAVQAWGQEEGMKATLEIQNYQQKISTTPPSTSNTPAKP